jgi:hypothetical protein
LIAASARSGSVKYPLNGAPISSSRVQPVKRLHLLVDVGDDAGRIGGHQCVDIGFDQRACVELLVAQALIGLLLLFLDQFARGVVGAD